MLSILLVILELIVDKRDTFPSVTPSGIRKVKTPDIYAMKYKKIVPLAFYTFTSFVVIMKCLESAVNSYFSDN